MMKNLYNADFRLTEIDRMVEMVWVRKNLSNIENSKIADFGSTIKAKCGQRYAHRLGWHSFNISDSNKVTAFDVEHSPELEGQYIQVDLLDENPLKENVFDIGICVSALEHFGLTKYKSKHKMDNGDEIGLKNMMKSIRPGGKFLLTVPCGRGNILHGWIREYSPDSLRHLTEQFGSVGIDYFLYDNGFWFEVDETTLVEAKLKEPPQRDLITGLACVIITKLK